MLQRVVWWFLHSRKQCYDRKKSAMELNDSLQPRICAQIANLITQALFYQHSDLYFPNTDLFEATLFRHSYPSELSRIVFSRSP